MASGATQTPTQVAGRVAVRTLLVGLLLGIAIAVPFFGDIMSLIGGTAVTGCAVILPAAVYLKLRGDRLTAAERTFAWAVLAGGCGVAALATISATARTAADAVAPDPLADLNVTQLFTH
eukprot:TRINITY_DN9157_c0_g1_i1.p3 TRINITY_DN9157_c0_g1~~TRINITY_DN9157_c0_g1_i1.p3  ORF type:complete len:120 (+),score=30.09 TRINITY_DN9157_c0_g1_i1:235-594(+)